ncbi:helix-turn-helix domain-containing protein [Pedobacter metabolipauper]|uniref:Helix-turn-helix protein n=1 Tax=Pedobacter metabolipauper TaxID=425513 RepID=A0A4R6T2M7_9SPHI|nr:helix-turn-helix transcriptional regulator [Pedobacter metabolipauper]TDQ11611.1 helix-turn-helix protein [Pedobacter metabolipauper]
MKSLGEKFKILRQKKGVNQRSMAQLLKISIPAYSKLETGITDPNYSRILQIAGLYDMSVKQLLAVGEEESDEHSLLVVQLKQKITELESNVIRLQGKLIDLYDREDKRSKH